MYSISYHTGLNLTTGRIKKTKNNIGYRSIFKNLSSPENFDTAAVQIMYIN